MLRGLPSSRMRDDEFTFVLRPVLGLLSRSPHTINCRHDFSVDETRPACAWLVLDTVPGLPYFCRNPRLTA